MLWLIKWEGYKLRNVNSFTDVKIVKGEVEVKGTLKT